MTDQEAELHRQAMDYERRAAVELLLSDSSTDDDIAFEHLDAHEEFTAMADQARLKAARLQAERTAKA